MAQGNILEGRHDHHHGPGLWHHSQLELMVGVGLLDLTLKLIYYFRHERAWDMIRIGRTIHAHESPLSLLTRILDIEAP